MKKTISIFNQIKGNFVIGERFTANNFAQQVGISRSMASNYLNQLVKMDMLEKTNTRPVEFWYEADKDVFADLIGKEGSMEKIVQQCKASVDYPPDGLPIIIKGNSGVGKSMLAKLIYQYAQNNQVVDGNAPFITLNCADYANNPELLSATLFGYVKGAFTGADKDKKGLLDAADKGYLFLDEVHNLSQENQEKLFLLIDQKKFRRLGEDERYCTANIRLILATTENIENKLLTTFRRRIPLEITLPDYHQRSRKERIQLVYSFFQQESIQMKKDVWIAPPFFQKLIDLDLEGNIGAIQNQIKIVCATAFNVYKNQNHIIIPADEKVEEEHLIKIPFLTATLREILSPEVKGACLRAEFIENCSLNEVRKRLPELIAKAKRNHETTSSLFSEYDLIHSLLKKNMDKANQFGIKFQEQHLAEIALLIDLIGEGEEHLTYEKDLDLVRYYKVIEYILQSCGRQRKANLIKDVLLAYLMEKLPIMSRRSALIVMHGKSIASSLAFEVNNLVGNYVFDAFDMPIQVETKEIVKHVNEYVTGRDTREGLLLLVDMGSLEKMYEEIKDNVAGDLLIVNNVSTALALDIGFALIQNRTMEYYTTIDYQQFNVRPQYFEGLSQIENIVVSCMSGEGIAQKIKDIFLSQESCQPVELITIDFETLMELESTKQMTVFKNTYAIISTSPIEIPGVKCLNLEQIVNGTVSLDSLRKVYNQKQLAFITNEIIKLFTIEGASSRLRFLNPDMVINEIESIIQTFELRFDIQFKSFIRVNLFLHLSSMIERILINDVAEDDGQQELSEELTRFIQVAEELFDPIKQKYNIEIPNREYDYIYKIISLEK